MGLSDLDHFLGGPLGGWAGPGWHTNPVKPTEATHKSRFSFSGVRHHSLNHPIEKQSISSQWPDKVLQLHPLNGLNLLFMHGVI